MFAITETTGIGATTTSTVAAGDVGFQALAKATSPADIGRIADGLGPNISQ
ncbi:hypothetical protein NKJ46_29645 [Mesorhizobium sp. M0166]|uniref:hypothetical protein n=1 Tax=unclassified Mesorhizobium TaxID=325217 RepID=UPI003334D483